MIHLLKWIYAIILTFIVVVPVLVITIMCIILAFVFWDAKYINYWNNISNDVVDRIAKVSKLDEK